MTNSYRADFPVCFLALALLLAAACDSGALSVGQIMMDPSSLYGQRVRVRGWSGFGYLSAGVGCAAADPCCNATHGILTLNAEPISAATANVQGIGIPDFACAKDGCNLQCSPFDPTAAAFELVGVLGPTAAATAFGQYSVALSDIDWQASRQLAGSGDLMNLQAVSLTTGRFTVTPRLD